MKAFLALILNECANDLTPMIFKGTLPLHDVILSGFRLMFISIKNHECLI